MNHIYDEYIQIPPVTRAYTTICALTTIAVHLDFVSPLHLYFNPTLIFRNYQLWRLVTNFCFFGQIGFTFFFNMIFIYRYCRMLEENHFRAKEADFILMFIFGGTLMMIIGSFFAVIFLGHAFTLMIVYVWSRRNPYIRMNFFGLFNFHAPYLPWVLFGFSFLLNNSVLIDMIGIGVGHLYYFLEDVFPRQTNGFKILRTPRFLKSIFESPAHDPNYEPLDEGGAAVNGAAGANNPGGFGWGDARNG